MELKAYKVGNPMDDEGRMALVHAETPNRARFAVANTDEVGNYSYTELRASRVPSFDGLTGDDLFEAQLRAGWWWECHGCYKRVSIDTPHRVNRHGTLFCSPSCCLTHERQERQLRAEAWEAIRRAVHFWPGASIEKLFKSSVGTWIVWRYEADGELRVDNPPEGPIP